MKKLFVLLIAAVVAIGASAGVNNKIVKDAKVKMNRTELRHFDRFMKGDVQTVAGAALKNVDWNARQTNHAINDNGDLLWDFEDADQMNDWTVIDNDGDGFNWVYFNMTGVETGRMTPYEGEGLVSSASYDNETSTALTPDNWLVSPLITLKKSFHFWAAGQDANYAAEKFAVYVCVGDPTDLNNFVQVGEIKTATGSYVEYGFDMSDYEGQQGYIAIRHFNVTDMFWLNVDYITVNDTEVIPEPEPEPEPTVITDIPEGCQVYTYYRNSSVIYSSWGIGAGFTDGKFNVAFDLTNGDVYIQDPAWYAAGNGAWVKGTYDWMTGIISIPTGQYLSWNSSYGYGIVLGWGSTYVYEDGVDEETGEPNYYLGTEIDERTTEIQFMIDGDDIYLLGTDGDLNAEFPENFNAVGMYTYWSDDLSFTSIEFANRDEYGYEEYFGRIVNLVPAVPANPTADDWYDCGDESGFSKFYFTLPTEDVDGNPLDPEYLSYSVYVDNGNGPEIFHFTGDDYTFDLDPDADLTEIPYSLYSSAVDFHNYYIYMYRTNEEGFEPLFTENIGIQVFYTVNGEKNASEIVWLYDIDTNVAETLAGKTVANVRYFNAAGQEMAEPNGLTIKVTTYTDGTTNAVKVMK